MKRLADAEMVVNHDNINVTVTNAMMSQERQLHESHAETGISVVPPDRQLHEREDQRGENSI
jgi:hypothetical protein